MNVCTALVQLRKEIGMKQVDLANALGVNAVTVNRWETGKNPPNRTMSKAIIACAKANGASKICMDSLNDVLFSTKAEAGIDSLKYAGLEQVNELVNDSSNGVFICNADTYELLYINKQMAKITDTSVKLAKGKKCYEFIFGKTSPCEFCPSKKLSATQFTTHEYESAKTGRYYVSRSKMITWNGVAAHIEYVTDITEIHRVQKELEFNRELLSTVCQNAGIWAFMLDIESGTAHIEQPMQNIFHLPYTIPDFMPKAAKMFSVPSEYQQKLFSILTKLQNGVPYVEEKIMAGLPGKPLYLVRFIAKAIKRDNEVKPVSAVCSVQLADANKHKDVNITPDITYIFD